jgi:hypothetical protein
VRAHSTYRAIAVVAVLVTATAVSSTACGGGSPSGGSRGDVEFEPTAEFLAAAIERTSDRTALRIEADVAMRVAASEAEPVDIDVPVATRVQRGEHLRISLDMGPFTDALGEALAPADAPPPPQPPGGLALELLSDGEAVYVRGPLYRTLAARLVAAGVPPAEVGPLGELSQVADRWGRAVGPAGGPVGADDIAPSDVTATAAGAPDSDALGYLDLLSDAPGARALGGDKIGDVAVNGLGAEVALGVFLDYQGLELADLLGPLVAPPPDVTGAADAVHDVEVPFEVWVDRAGVVRRVGYEIDVVAIVASLPGGSQALDVSELRYGLTMDISYGEGTVDGADLTTPADSVDVSSAFAQLLLDGAPASLPLPPASELSDDQLLRPSSDEASEI